MSVPGFNISNRTSLFTGVDSKLDYAFTEPEVEKNLASKSLFMQSFNENIKGDIQSTGDIIRNNTNTKPAVNSEVKGTGYCCNKFSYFNEDEKVTPAFDNAVTDTIFSQQLFSDAEAERVYTNTTMYAPGYSIDFSEGNIAGRPAYGLKDNNTL